jgi:hypothetical protein
VWEAGFLAFHPFHTLSFPWPAFPQGHRGVTATSTSAMGRARKEVLVVTVVDECFGDRHKVRRLCLAEASRHFDEVGRYLSRPVAHTCATTSSSKTLKSPWKRHSLSSNDRRKRCLHPHRKMTNECKTIAPGMWAGRWEPGCEDDRSFTPPYHPKRRLGDFAKRIGPGMS